MKQVSVNKAILNRLEPQKKHDMVDVSYEWPKVLVRPSEKALAVSAELRGAKRPPALMLHGVMQRSGTNFVGDLLNLHPDLSGYPGNIWEAPFLNSSHLLREAQDEFFKGFQRNREQIGSTDFLPLFGASFIAYLYSQIADGQQILVKTPGVEQIWDFQSVFYHEKLIILQRDGRDLIASTVNTWPDTDFEAICQRWNKSQRLILRLKTQSTGKNVCFEKYEDAVADGKGFISSLLSRLEIDDSQYPYDEIDTLPVKGSSSLKKNGQMNWFAVEKPRTFNPIGRWKLWSEKEKNIFKKASGETLIQSGYAEDLEW